MGTAWLFVACDLDLVLFGLNNYVLGFVVVFVIIRIVFSVMTVWWLLIVLLYDLFLAFWILLLVVVLCFVDVSCFACWLIWMVVDCWLLYNYLVTIVWLLFACVFCMCGFGCAFIILFLLCLLLRLLVLLLVVLYYFVVLGYVCVVYLLAYCV